MNRRYIKKQSTSKIKNIISTYIEKNLKEFIIIFLLFIIGIIAGVIFINKTSQIQKEEITSYITTFISDLKTNKDVDDIPLLIESIKKNVFLAVFLWFMGSTVIGIFIVYITICFRGFCLGYTISSIILSLRGGKWNFIGNFNNIISKYFIYTMYNYTCGKWD